MSILKETVALCWFLVEKTLRSILLLAHSFVLKQDKGKYDIGIGSSFKGVFEYLTVDEAHPNPHTNHSNNQQGDSNNATTQKSNHLTQHKSFFADIFQHASNQLEITRQYEAN